MTISSRHSSSFSGRVVPSSVLALLVFQSETAHAFTIQRYTRRGDSSLDLPSSLSDDGDFALVGLNAEAPLNDKPFEVTNTQASAFGLQSAEDNMASSSPNEENTLNQNPDAPMPSRRNPVAPRTTPSNNSQDHGLTADGDFILEGINAIDPTANKGLEKYGSPLINTSQGGSSDGGLLSQLVGGIGNTDQAQDNSSSNNLSGLTEDGDIALVGLNSAQSVANSDGVQQNQLLASLRQQPAVTPAAATPAAATPAASSFVERENSEEEVEDMTMWLQDIIPTLGDNDCIYYAEQLVSLGFHPDCETQCELRLADMKFMKPLHSRYVFHEIKGIPHPPKQLDKYDYDLEQELYEG